MTTGTSPTGAWVPPLAGARLASKVACSVRGVSTRVAPVMSHRTVVGTAVAAQRVCCARAVRPRCVHGAAPVPMRLTKRGRMPVQWHCHTPSKAACNPGKLCVCICTSCNRPLTPLSALCSRPPTRLRSAQQHGIVCALCCAPQAPLRMRHNSGPESGHSRVRYRTTEHLRAAAGGGPVVGSARELKEVFDEAARRKRLPPNAGPGNGTKRHRGEGQVLRPAPQAAPAALHVGGGAACVVVAPVPRCAGAPRTCMRCARHACKAVAPCASSPVAPAAADPRSAELHTRCPCVPCQRARTHLQPHHRTTCIGNRAPSPWHAEQSTVRSQALMRSAPAPRAAP